MRSSRRLTGVDRAVANSPPACPDIDQGAPHPDELAMGQRPSSTARERWFFIGVIRLWLRELFA